MSGKSSLTAEQEKLLTDRIEQCLAWSHSTEPLDRVAATEAIGALYESVGVERPAVLFFSSPLMCVLAWDVLRARAPQSRAQRRRRRWLKWACWVADLPLLGQDSNDCSQAVRFFARVAAARLEAAQNHALAQGNAVLHNWHGDLHAQLRTLGLSRLERVSHFIHVLAQALGGVRALMRAKGLSEELNGEIGEQLAQLGNHPVDATAIIDPLRDLLEDNDRLWSVACSGNWSAWLYPLQCSSAMPIGYHPKQLERQQLWVNQSQHCHIWFQCQKVVLASDRPRRLFLDAAERLHNPSGPALEYGDGLAVYAWHGVCVEPRIITDPGSITVEEIEREGNAEIRRVMIERYGWKRYIADCGAEIVDQIPDDHPIVGLRGARLLRKWLDTEREPIVYLEMVNASPQPDGSCKRYLQRIDPSAYNGDAGHLCHAAMASLWRHRDDKGQLASTFRRWKDYQPTAES